MKKIIALLCAIMLLGCSSCGVSQDQYESVVAERDEYKEKFESVSDVVENMQETTKEATIQAEQEETEQEEPKQETVAQENNEGTVEIIADYTLPDSIGWYTYRFLVLKNNSSKTMDVSTSSLAYDVEGKMIAATDSSFDALGAGCTSVLVEGFETDVKIDHYETEMNSFESEYYESVIQDLSYVQNDIDEGAVFQITNNGQEPAEFVEGYALFFNGDKLVEFKSAYFTDDDNEIKPGKTISEQMTAYEDFDRIEFYLTGRR